MNSLLGWGGLGLLEIFSCAWNEVSDDSFGRLASQVSSLPDISYPFYLKVVSDEVSQPARSQLS
jgi:hypothetical protein